MKLKNDLSRYQHLAQLQTKFDIVETLRLEQLLNGNLNFLIHQLFSKNQLINFLSATHHIIAHSFKNFKPPLMLPAFAQSLTKNILEKIFDENFPIQKAIHLEALKILKSNLGNNFDVDCNDKIISFSANPKVIEQFQTIKDSIPQAKSIKINSAHVENEVLKWLKEHILVYELGINNEPIIDLIY